jgi:Bacterial protein of unknown function (DUF839)
MRRAFLILAALALVAAAMAPATSATSGVKTTKPPYVVPTAQGVIVDPILSTGDIVGTYQMSGIPDGLGAYPTRGHDDDDDGDDDGRHGDDDDRSKSFVVVMNHELGRSFPNNPPGVDARISRLEIDRKSRSVLDAEYLFTGVEGFERFCSSTLSMIRGRPLYFTGEEAVPIPGQPPGPAHDGSSIVLDPETGMWRETPHFGHLQHENVVPLRLSKWVFLTSEDDFRAGLPSYLYAYIADDFNRAVRGRSGSLYVWRADDPSNNQNSAVTKGESIPGHFVPISQAENANSTELKNAATAKNAFRFDRLEDIAVRPDIRGRTYIADTGKAPPGQPTARGRVYQFDINPRDPTRATLKMILNGDAPDGDDVVNPDNMDASERVLVIQEDRESAFRGEPSRVLVYNFESKTLTSVARVSRPETATRFNWESSGVISARHVLGKNWWLLDVQAHDQQAPQPGPSLAPNSSTGEDGQLLAIYIPNSMGGGDRDD